MEMDGWLHEQPRRSAFGFAEVYSLDPSPERVGGILLISDADVVATLTLIGQSNRLSSMAFRVFWRRDGGGLLVSLQLSRGGMVCIKIVTVIVRMAVGAKASLDLEQAAKCWFDRTIQR